MKIGDVLVNLGFIEKTELMEALHKQSVDSIIYDKPSQIGKVLIELGYINVDKLTKALNKQNEHH